MRALARAQNKWAVTTRALAWARGRSVLARAQHRRAGLLWCRPARHRWRCCLPFHNPGARAPGHVSGRCLTEVMTSAATTQTPAVPVHAQLRANTSALVALEVERAKLVVAWVEEHRVDGESRRGAGLQGDLTGRGLELAGEGAPRVDDLEFCTLAAALGQSVDGARQSVGEIVELAFRLPVLWQRVRQGQVRLWRARRVARSTCEISWQAAAWVDRQVAPLVTSCTAAQLERTVTAAMAHFDPEQAQERRQHAADRRRFDVQLHEAGTPVAEPGTGTVHVDGLLDQADALDLEAAVRAGAAAVARVWPDTAESVCRSIAVGDLARGQRSLAIGSDHAGDTGPRSFVERAPQIDAPVDAPGAGGRREQPAARPPHRTITLYLHLAASSVDPASHGAGGQEQRGGAALGIGRCENTRAPITAEQIRQWCQAAGTILVRPVIDLAANPRTDAYEASPRMREQVVLRDGHCVFPYCTRPARRADLDHVDPYDRGGPTQPTNLAPLCRRHHRAKTFSTWDYAPVAPGTYLWRDPHGTTYLVTGAGSFLMPWVEDGSGGRRRGRRREPQTVTAGAPAPPPP